MTADKASVILTGCAGFIGSNFVRKIACRKSVAEKYNFIILDALTYAGHYGTIASLIEQNDNLSFLEMDIRDNSKLEELFNKKKISGIINFAAESHVDRSIENPNIFLETNVLGTMNLLNCALKAFKQDESFRYLQVSTDEVYGSLTHDEEPFGRGSILKPNSPYSASKASADLIVLSYFKTYGLPTIVTRCSNNYGPHQFPEKFIPLIINKAINNEPLPIYGEGLNVRDWIHVDDHNDGVWAAYCSGLPGEVYNFGGSAEKRNIDVAKIILKKLDRPESLLSFVKDRLGHDFRYAIDFKESLDELGWSPSISFEHGIEQTVNWYLENLDWTEEVSSKG